MNRSAGIAESNPLSPVNKMANGFPSPIVSRRPDGTGITYAMQFQPRVIGAPTVPVQPRSSLAQLVEKYRVQQSRYISRFQNGGSVQPMAAAGYPAAKGHTVVNTAPPQSRRPYPVTSGRAAARPSTMAPPPRWRKALPLPVVPFNPATYGDSNS